MSDDTELLLAHPGFSEVQDGIEHLDGMGCMPESASAIRLLDQQNNARGREIDRLRPEVERLTALLCVCPATIPSEFDPDPACPIHGDPRHVPAPLHYTLTGTRSVCGETARLKGGGTFRLAFDPDDDQIDCPACRLFLAGVRAGKGGE